jgi:hypothetical protein
VLLVIFISWQVSGENKMKYFLRNFPRHITALSKAFLRSFRELIEEITTGVYNLLEHIGRLFFRVLRNLWKIYCRFELQLIGIFVDIGLLLLTFVCSCLPLAVGVTLAHFQWWVPLALYISVFIVGVFRHFEFNKSELQRVSQVYQKSFEFYTNLLKLPFRFSVMVSSFLISASFFGWWPLRSNSSENPAKKQQVSERSSPAPSKPSSTPSTRNKNSAKATDKNRALTKSEKAVASNLNKSAPRNNYSPTQTSTHPSAVTFVEIYYQLLNERNYKNAWSRLSTNFQSKAQDYKQWWDKVKSIRVSNVKNISQNKNSATIEARISYELKDGRIKQDDNKRIYLIWNKTKNEWEIDK